MYKACYEAMNILQADGVQALYKWFGTPLVYDAIVPTLVMGFRIMDGSEE